MRTKPFTVIQNGKPIFTVYAYSLAAAKAVAAAKVAAATIVVAVAKEMTVPLCSPATKVGASR